MKYFIESKGSVQRSHKTATLSVLNQFNPPISPIKYNFFKSRYVSCGTIGLYRVNVYPDRPSVKRGPPYRCVPPPVVPGLVDGRLACCWQVLSNFIMKHQPQS